MERTYGEFFGTGLLYGVVDPSMPPGIEARPGTLYARNNEDVGELWLKVGLGDIDWDEIVPKKGGGKP